MSDDDPFAEPGDVEQTVIRPAGTGRRVAGGPQASTPPAGSDAGVARPLRQPAAAPGDGGEIVRTGVNPLVSVASPLLELAVRVRNRAQHRDVAALRERVVAEIRAFEARAAAVRVSPQEIRAARYALCATIDDLILNTPWGSRSVWARQSMVTTFYQETWGGERFYEILNRLGQNPGRNLALLELMYLCMTLGFEGQYRVMNRGAARHGDIRDGLYRMIRRQRGEFERDLSPRWRGAEAGHRPLTSYIPIWVLAVITAGLLMLAYTGFVFALNRGSDGLYDAMVDLPPTGPVVLARAATPPAPLTPTPQEVEQRETLRAFLAPEIAEGLVEVFEQRDGTLVRLVGDGMFASGSADLTERYVPTVLRVAAALDDRPGQVLITGHTDNVPINTLRFPSNWHLSVERAQAVRDLMAEIVQDDGRMQAEGRADTDPIADNATRAGQARNRRIEILLLEP